ncbi:MAG: glycosyltransferase [Candidatus Omnitrophota bacterium]
MSKKRIVYIVNRWGHPLQKFFIKYVRESGSAEVTVLQLPAIHSDTKRFKLSAFAITEAGQNVPFELDLWFPFGSLFKITLQYFLNFFITFKLLRRAGIKYFDICIGEVGFNGAIALILKKLGKCKFSIFMNGDIIPNSAIKDKVYYLDGGKRKAGLAKFFDNFLIRFQYWLRRIGYKNDLIWYPNRKVMEWDAQAGYIPRKYFIAPVAVDNVMTEVNLKSRKNNNEICYIGGLYENSGFNIILSSLKAVKEKISNIKLLVVGGDGSSIETYRKLVTSYGISDNVKFFGFLPDEERVFSILSGTMLGLAAYRPSKSNVSLYTDSSKVKMYISAGIPVVITRGGPSVWEDIERFKSGLIVDYDDRDIARKVISALTDKSYYTELQAGVSSFAKEYDYRRLFKEAWSNIETEFNRKFN